MQLAAADAISKSDDIMVLSPTGSGKTLAFLLPLIEQMSAEPTGIEVLILVPSRELAMQIEQVARSLGSGYKVNAVYGGRAGSQDRIDLSHTPSILIGTPGRVADHVRTETIDVKNVKCLILDEFDKSLEVGFEMDMTEIISEMSGLKKRILTSATSRIEVPKFVGFSDPVTVDFLQDQKPDITLEGVSCQMSHQDEALKELVNELSGKSGIIFCNFRDTVAYISDMLKQSNIPHGSFHGDMEQRDREKALIKFRNGTHQILVATDLAARGLDIPDLHFIIHYQLPLHEAEFVHRNGRTARMNKDGTAYVILPRGERIPEYVGELPEHVTGESDGMHDTEWATLYVSGGRRDKISKGDIAGLFLKQGGLDKEELGLIEIKQDSAYVAVKKTVSHMAIEKTTNTRLKKKKVRIGLT